MIIAQDRDDLEFITRQAVQEYNDWTLDVNMTKTMYIRLEGDK